MAVPKEMNFDEPWDLEVGYLDETALEEDLDVQNSQDSEALPDELQEKFDNLAESEDKDFKKACVGTSFSELMQQIADTAWGNNSSDAATPAESGRKMAEAEQDGNHDGSGDEAAGGARVRRRLCVASSSEEPSNELPARGSRKAAAKAKGTARKNPPAAKPIVKVASLPAKTPKAPKVVSSKGARATDLLDLYKTHLSEFQVCVAKRRYMWTPLRTWRCIGALLGTRASSVETLSSKRRVQLSTQRLSSF